MYLKSKKITNKVVLLYNISYLCTMRKIIAYKNYFSDFIKKLSTDEINKIRRALDLFKVEDRMPRHFIKFIRDGIYEFRVTYGNNEFRIFSYMTVILSLFSSTLSKRKRRGHLIMKLKRL